ESFRREPIMYLPLDPSKTEGLWEKFYQSLEEGAFVYIVSEGKQSCGNGMTDDPRLIIERFKKCGYSRIGTSRSVPVPAHFGVRIDDKVGYLQEYIAHDGSQDQIESDLRKLVQLIFYEMPTLTNLVIPFELMGLSDQGVVVETKCGVTEI